MARDDDASVAVNEAIAKRNEEYRAEAAKGVDARLEARDRLNAEYMERAAQCQPTPTQREVDLFRVGALTVDDEKEDDGSEWETDHIRRIMQAKLPGENPYDTRMEVGENGNGDQPRRGPGRPRKSE